MPVPAATPDVVSASISTTPVDWAAVTALPVVVLPPRGSLVPDGTEGWVCGSAVVFGAGSAPGIVRVARAKPPAPSTKASRPATRTSGHRFFVATGTGCGS